LLRPNRAITAAAAHVARGWRGSGPTQGDATRTAKDGRPIASHNSPWRDRYRAYGLARTAAWSSWSLSSLPIGRVPRAGTGGVACAEANELESVTGRILTSVSARRRACDAIDSVGRLQPPRRRRHRRSARPSTHVLKMRSQRRCAATQYALGMATATSPGQITVSGSGW
jgi:hypothetical protein